MENTSVIDEIYRYFVASNYSICNDSRSMKQGDVFFCICGEKYDGNLFAEEALKMGAMAVIVDHPELKDRKEFIWVEDSIFALQQLGKMHASQMPCKKIMVGGSNGKTTTKEVSRNVLEGIGVVLATPGNWNNHIGVPLTLLQLKPHHKFAIIEMGTNHPGEMKVLCDLLGTDIGLITNIGKEHLEGFGTIEEVAKEESEVYMSVIVNDGWGIVNSDDTWLNSMSKRLKNNLSISLKDSSANFYVSIDSEMPSLNFRFYHNQISVGEFNSPLSGGYNAYNLLFGAALGVHFGLNPKESMSLACSYKPSNNRSEWRSIGDTEIFLDAYNANPSSMKFAVESFATLGGAKSFFLGDMLELGEHSLAEHLELFQMCKSLGITDSLYLVGREFYNACESHPYRFETIDSLLAWLDTHPIETKYAFVKGSRGIRMERIVEHFLTSK